MKRLAKVLAMGLGLFGLSFLGARFYRAQILLHSPKAPYTAVFETRVTDPATGAITLTSPHILAQRTDGSTVRADLSAAPGKHVVVRTLRIVPERKKVLIGDEVGRISTEFTSQETVLASLNSPSDPTCRTHPELIGTGRVIGTTTFLGLSVVKWRFSEDANGQKMIWELWEAPDLGCLVINQVLDVYAYDKLVSRSETVAVSVTRGEPNSELFLIPASYTEGPPSTVVTAIGGPQAVTAEKMRRADDTYRSAQRFAPR